MTNPRVSILLPTYNCERFIVDAIKSVLAQSFDDWELIVIDDGSTDNTSDIVREFSGTDNRIRYIKNEKNLGIQKSLNRGLKESKGEYIARIDDDDEWIDVGKIEKQVKFLDENPDYVLVGTGTIVVDASGNEMYRFLAPAMDKNVRGRMLSMNCFTHSSVMFRKDAVLKLGGYGESEEVRHVEDYDLWLRLGLVGKLANLPIYGVKFRIRRGALSESNKMEQFKKDLELARRFKDIYPNYFLAILRGYARVLFYGVFNFIPLAAIKNKILKIYKSF